MAAIFRVWKMNLQIWLNKLLIRIVDVSGSNEIVKVITKNVGLTWVEMENHVEVKNTFFIPYRLEEVKLTYYNDSNQNIGYLHYKGSVRLGAYSKKTVIMPAKMSNITALFNMVRLIVLTDIKTKTVGTSTISIFGMRFILPINDIMIIDKDKIEMEDEETRARRLEARKERDILNAQKRVERAEKRKIRKAEREKRFEKQKIRAAARRRLNRMKAKAQKRKRLEVEQPEPNEAELPIKKPQQEIAAADKNSSELTDVSPKQEFSKPDPDKFYSDPST